MNLLRGLSLFANVGIAEAYLADNGIDILLANEIDEKRAEFYKHVYPNTEMICGDITHDDIRNRIIELSLKYKIDFIIATPPCQGMSEAGLRLDFDERNQLIFYAIDVIKKVKPKFVLLENVPQQLKTKIQYNDRILLIPEYIKEELGNEYNFNKNSLIMAKDYGVPQLRERNIFLLVRKDIDVSWEFPEKQNEITLYDAIGNLPSVDPILREGMDFTISKFPCFYKKCEEAMKISKWHYPPTHSWKQVEWMMHTPTGKSAIYNEVYFPQKADGTRVKAHHNNYRRLKWDMPCRTITQNNGVISSLACVHPGRQYVKNNEILYTDPRVLTIYELMIVTSLPLNWNIPDWANDSMIRKVIGEGIPPRLVEALVKQLLYNLS